MLLENKIEQEQIIEVKETEIQEEEAVITPKKKRVKKQPKKEVNVDEDGELDLTEQIEFWKRQYKKIFKNEIDGEVIIWRRLKRGEYKDILKFEEDDEDDRILIKQERMVKTTVLYPFDVNALIEDNAGLATVLSEEVLAKSGFAMSFTEEL